jgi:hypothetical protein
VSVDVYNGTWTGGLSATTGKELAALGFSVHRDGLNWAKHNVIRTMIQYPADQLSQARLLLKVLPGATLRAVKNLPRLRLVLGTSGAAVTGQAPSPAASPTSPVQERTAAQDACR